MMSARLMDNQKMLDQTAPDRPAGLVQVNQELEGRVAERTAALERALVDRELLLRELNHRVKNNLQVVSSILGLQSGQTENLEVSRQLRDAQTRVTALGVVHDLLHEGSGVGHLNTRTLLTRLALCAIEIFDPMREQISLDIDVAAPPDPAGSGDPAVDAGLGAADQRPQARLSQWPARYDPHHLARSHRSDLPVGCRQRHRVGRGQRHGDGAGTQHHRRVRPLARR